MINPSHPIRIAILITCHNRREKTLSCLSSIYRQALPENCNVQVFLLDDGSNDGTSKAISELHPEVHLLQGSGSLFWCGGMRKAWEVAALEHPDAYLWINDDVVLGDTACSNLILTAAEYPDSVIVGSCSDPIDGTHAYGGQCRVGRHPGRVIPLAPTEQPQQCDTFQGNIVWVPQSIYKAIGGMAAFTHAMADTDYGYRTRKAGFKIIIAAGFLGTCPRNPGDRAWNRPGISLRNRWRSVTSIKGLPPKDWLHFCRSHGGLLWPIYFASPYIKAVLHR